MEIYWCEISVRCVDRKWRNIFVGDEETRQGSEGLRRREMTRQSFLHHMIFLWSLESSGVEVCGEKAQGGCRSAWPMIAFEIRIASFRFRWGTEDYAVRLSNGRGSVYPAFFTQFRFHGRRMMHARLGDERDCLIKIEIYRRSKQDRRTSEETIEDHLRVYSLNGSDCNWHSLNGNDCDWYPLWYLNFNVKQRWHLELSLCHIISRICVRP